MRDEQTGSWWQQVTGEAIQGPLKGKKLNSVFNDELTFATWKREKPQGRVLKPDAQFEKGYVPADWEKDIEKMPLVTSPQPGDELTPRTLIAGITLDGKARAFPVADLQKQRLILDTVGNHSMMLVVGDDNQSFRAYERVVDGRVLEFFVRPETSPLQLVDAETGTSWDFTGRAISGSLAGKQLKKIPVLRDYWFDWKIYNPTTSVYKLGRRSAS